MDQRRTNSLVFFAFDLLYLDGKSTAALPLIERKQRLHPLFAQAVPGLHFTDHVVGNGAGVLKHACEMGLEGVISKRLEQPYMPGNRGLWLKSKCLNREEFVVVGWTDRRRSGGLGDDGSQIADQPSLNRTSIQQRQKPIPIESRRLLRQHRSEATSRTAFNLHSIPIACPGV